MKSSDLVFGDEVDFHLMGPEGSKLLDWSLLVVLLVNPLEIEEVGVHGDSELES